MVLIRVDTCTKEHLHGARPLQHVDELCVHACVSLLHFHGVVCDCVSMIYVLVFALCVFFDLYVCAGISCVGT